MRAFFTAPWLLAGALALAGCSDNSMRDVEQFDATAMDSQPRVLPDGAVVDVPPVVDQDAFTHVFDDAACRAFYRQYNDRPGLHLDPSVPITYDTVPPCHGDHYADWLRYGIYQVPVSPARWVHNLEHGAVAVLYRCVGDCTALRTQLESFVRGLEPEVSCIGRGVPRRIVLLPYPDLDTNVAAAAWNWTYGADCFDPPSLEAFIRFRTGRGPEDTCLDGPYTPP